MTRSRGVRMLAVAGALLLAGALGVRLLLMYGSVEYNVRREGPVTMIWTDLEPIVRDLTSGQPEKRAAAARSIAYTVHEHPAVTTTLTTAQVEVLCDLLASPEPGVRETCVIVLGRGGPAAVRAVPQLVKLASHPEPSVRSHVAAALLCLGVSTPAVQDAIAALSTDSDAGVREETARAIASPCPRVEIPPAPGHPATPAADREPERLPRK